MAARLSRTFRAAGNRRRQDPRHAPFDKSCYIGCGVTTGVGAVVNTAKVTPGANVVVFGLGGIGLNVIQGARMVGADKIIGVDRQRQQGGMGPPLWHDPFRQPVEGRWRHRRASGRADRRRRRLPPSTALANTTVDRRHWRPVTRGWGVSVVIGVAEAGKEISTRPFQLVTGRVWKARVRRRARPTRRAEKSSTWYMNGKIEIDPMIHARPQAGGDQQGLRSDADGRATMRFTV